MTLIRTEFLKALDYGSAGGPFVEAKAKATIVSAGQVDFGFNGGPFASMALGGVTYEADISLGAGVKAEMTATHLVEGLALAAGVRADFAGESRSLIGPHEHKFGVNVDFTATVESLYRELPAGAGVKAQFDPIHQVDSFPAAAGVRVTLIGNKESEKPLAPHAGIRAVFVGAKDILTSLAPHAGIRVSMERSMEYAVAIAAAAGIHASFDGFNWTAFLRNCADRISIRYIATLTGDVPLILPISSFQGRFRQGEPSYLAVTIPGSDQYEAIALNSDGDLVLTMQYVLEGVVFVSEIICTVDLQDIRIDEGSGSASVTISGHRTTTFSPKQTVLTGVSMRSFDGTKYRFRCAPDIYLRPGDTCNLDGYTFTAGLVTWFVNPSGMMLEVSEL